MADRWHPLRRRVRPAIRWQRSGCARSSSFFCSLEDEKFPYKIRRYNNGSAKWLKTITLFLAILFLDNKPVRFGFRRYDTKVVSSSPGS